MVYQNRYSISTRVYNKNPATPHMIIADNLLILLNILPLLSNFPIILPVNAKAKNQIHDTIMVEIINTVLVMPS